MLSRAITIAFEVAVSLTAMVVSGAFPIELPNIHLPLTLQSMCAIALPLLLPGRTAVAGVFLYLVMAALGAPVLAGGVGGFEYFKSPSAGYLVGFLLVAIISASSKPYHRSPRFLFLLAFFILQHLVITLSGLVGIMASGSGPLSWYNHIDPFLPGIIVKSFLGMLLVIGIETMSKFFRKKAVE